MNKDEGSKEYDLEKRTFQFGKCVRAFVRQLPRTISNSEDDRPLTRASGFVGATYIDANEALSKKDFVHRAKICRKEAKECRLFLRLIDVGKSAEVEGARATLVKEALELTKIFNAIVRKSSGD